MSLDRAKALDRIKRNIEKSGFHAYVIRGGPGPRFAYTIGLRETLGAELVLAGALYYETTEDVMAILHSIRNLSTKASRGSLDAKFRSMFDLGTLGSFTLRKARGSWTRSLLLGALDYYGVDDIDAYQIVPEERYRTIDVPNMATNWSATGEPLWKWLHEPWTYPVSKNVTAMTNLDALRGSPITEACRWEADYWELFAGPGPDVSKEDARLVPLGCLLAADPSLAPVVDLEIGKGVRREPGGDWIPWVGRSNPLD